MVSKRIREGGILKQSFVACATAGWVWDGKGDNDEAIRKGGKEKRI